MEVSGKLRLSVALLPYKYTPPPLLNIRLAEPGHYTSVSTIPIILSLSLHYFMKILRLKKTALCTLKYYKCVF